MLGYNIYKPTVTVRKIRSYQKTRRKDLGASRNTASDNLLRMRSRSQDTDGVVTHFFTTGKTAETAMRKKRSLFTYLTNIL